MLTKLPSLWWLHNYEHHDGQLFDTQHVVDYQERTRAHQARARERPKIRKIRLTRGPLMDIKIRSMEADDWGAVRAIYEQGIATGNATFETDVPTWEEWDRSHCETCRIVACLHDQIVGWAALSPISSRRIYAGVAEVSVYVAAAERRKGIGRKLLHALTKRSEEAGIWTLQAGIFPENEASIALHKVCGFSIVGRRERLGRMHNTWRDVVLMERRSRTTGIE